MIGLALMAPARWSAPTFRKDRIPLRHGRECNLPGSVMGMAMRFSQTGGCLCGVLRYEITEPPIIAYTCHCTACQKLTSSAFSLAILMTAEACRFTEGETRSFQRIAASGRSVTRWVCVECGIWVCNGAKPSTAPRGTIFALRAGTLEDTAWVRPTVHFWIRSAQPWVILPEGDMHFETQPEDGAAWLQSISNHQRRSNYEGLH